MAGKIIHTDLESFVRENRMVLYAPNGEISNLPSKLYKLVRTNEFKAWFGDWENDSQNASKMVDVNGEPLLVYHRTKTKFTVFDVDKQSNGWLGKGFYFTDDKTATKESGRIVISAFLNIRNPFIVNGNSPSDVITEINKKYSSSESIEFFTPLLKAHNHDGVFFKHWEKGNYYSCFYNEQIMIL